MSFAIVSLIILVVVAIIAIPILIRIFGEAASRNPNRPEGEGEDAGGDTDPASDRDPASGPGRE